MNTSIKYFDSTMSGAPVITTEVLGSTIAMLRACLVSGFGSVVVTNLTVDDGWAIVTVSTGHAFADAITGVFGPVARIEGATPAALNGDWRVIIVNATTCKFQVAGVANQTATGTISMKRAPAGWSEPYPGTNNEVVFRGNPETGCGWYFRARAINTEYSNITPYKTMDSISSGTRPGANVVIVNAYLLTGTAAGWWCVADDRTVYFGITERSSSAHKYHYGFGDFDPAVSSDIDAAFACGIGGFRGRSTDHDNTAISGANSPWYFNLTSGYLDQVSKIGGLVFPMITAGNLSGQYLPGSEALNTPFPNPLTGQLDAARITVLEGVSPRGQLRGVWAPQHKASALLDSMAYATPNGALARKLPIESLAITNRYGALLIDISEPW